MNIRDFDKQRAGRHNNSELLNAKIDIHCNLVMALAYYSVELHCCFLLSDLRDFEAVFRVLKKQVIELDANLHLGLNARANMSDNALVEVLFLLFSTWRDRLCEMIENKRTPSGVRVTREHARLMKRDIEKLYLAVRCLGRIARRKNLADALLVLKEADGRGK